MFVVFLENLNEVCNCQHSCIACNNTQIPASIQVAQLSQVDHAML